MEISIKGKNGVIGSIIFFLAFAVLGVLAMVLFGANDNKTSGWKETNSTICNIYNEKAFVSYDATDVGGTAYHYENIELNEYNSAWKIGDIVPIKYNPNKPSEIVSNTTGGKVLPYVIGGAFVGIGALGVVFTILKAKKDERVAIKESELQQQEQLITPVASNNTGSKKQTTFKLKDGWKIYYMSNENMFKKFCFSVKDPYNKDILDIHPAHFVLIGTTKVEIRNCLNNTVEVHSFGGVITKNGKRYENDAYYTDTSFKLDHQRVWSLFADKGYKIINSDYPGEFIVYKDSVECGRISINTSTGNERNNIVNFFKNYSNKDDYQLVCTEDNLIDFVLIAMSLSHGLLNSGNI